jgi:hypothetical protein
LRTYEDKSHQMPYDARQNLFKPSGFVCHHLTPCSKLCDRQLPLRMIPCRVSGLHLLAKLFHFFPVICQRQMRDWMKIIEIERSIDFWEEVGRHDHVRLNECRDGLQFCEIGQVSKELSSNVQIRHGNVTDGEEIFAVQRSCSSNQYEITKTKGSVNIYRCTNHERPGDHVPKQHKRLFPMATC